MPLLDIEHAINEESLKSRFKLVRLAGVRARELNANREGTLPVQTTEHHKITTQALAEIIEKRITFENVE